MPEELFVRRNLEQLRRQAKELLRNLRSGDPEALSRWTAQFSRRPTTPQMAHALAVIARENDFASWPKLKAKLEQASTSTQRLLRFRRRKGPKKLPSRQRVEELHAYTLQLVEAGDPAEFALKPSPSGQYGRTTARALRTVLVQRGKLEPVMQLALRGLRHPNAKVRYECAHALDWLGDDRCVPALLELLNDPVPRVRCIALHALKCDDCKLYPLQPRPDLMQLAVVWAEHDPSRRVRREASALLAQSSHPLVTRLMRTLATGASDHVVRGLARSYLRRNSPTDARAISRLALGVRSRPRPLGRVGEPSSK